MLTKTCVVLVFAFILGNMVVDAQTTCASISCKNGVCEIVNGTARCNCKSGYIGTLCDINDPCLNRDCKNGTCYPVISPDSATATFYCQCYSGYFGTSCETSLINVCGSKPCLNNGRCIEDKHEPGGYYCLCPNGYTGKNCGTFMNPCSTHKCKNNGICVPDAFYQNYTCSCYSGFLGFYCEQEINECLSEPCKNNATCYDLVDSYYCNCPPNYTGTNCQTYVSPCSTNPCKDLPNTVCKEENNTFSCPCKDGYFGDKVCKPDPCKSNPCKGPNSCIPIDNDEIVCMGPGNITINLPNYICKCPNGFASLYC